MNYSGVLVQADGEQAKLSPVERVRAAVAACEAKRGWRPGLVLVKPNGTEWPAEIDGVRIEPSPSMAYPAWMLLVPEAGENSTVEEHDATSNSQAG